MRHLNWWGICTFIVPIVGLTVYCIIIDVAELVKILIKNKGDM